MIPIVRINCKLFNNTVQNTYSKLKEKCFFTLLRIQEEKKIKVIIRLVFKTLSEKKKIHSV